MTSLPTFSEASNPEPPKPKKTWGWYAKDGTPIALGDDHWKWECPDFKWEYVEPDIHPFTGEPYRWPTDSEYRKVHNCRIQSRAVKCDECTKCGAYFVYP